MARSLKKGIFIKDSLKKKVENSSKGSAIKTWSRSSTITPDMIGKIFSVHNGRHFIEVKPTEDMVGHKLGEFVPTTKFDRHGGKMQKDLERRAKERERDEAKKAKLAAG